MNQTRRDFFRTTLKAGAFLSFAASAPSYLVRTAMAAAAPRGDCETVLVVIQLPGGNDGLNTVVPYADDAYGQNRPTLRQVAGQVHKIDSQLGFHPRMGAFHRLFQEGYLTVVQGVGYPNSDRNHPSAMRIWHTADPEPPGPQTGWLGRAADNLWNPPEGNIPAVFVGPTAQPFGINSENVVVPSVRSPRDLSGHDPQRPGQGGSGGMLVTKANDPWLDSLRQVTAQAHANARRIESVMRASGDSTDYPQFELAGDLRVIAQLIRADVGIRVFFTEFGAGGIGGFDNHANQLGNHCAVLHQLSEAIAAFVRDLKRNKVLDRVLLMTFSEFGRTVRENGRRGTDHGAAAPMFLAGGKVKGGLVGPHPSLTDLDKGGLRFHTDFRQVYATVLDRWLGLDSRNILSKPFKTLDLLNA